MTTPLDEFEFINQGVESGPTSVTLDTAPPSPETLAEVPTTFPDAILPLDKELEDRLRIYLEEQIDRLEAQQKKLLDAWAAQEEAYRAPPEAAKSFPFRGACPVVVPVIAMAVDPVHARLDIGVFKQDPVIIVKGLRKSYLRFVPALTAFIDFYQRHMLQLRSVFSPRLLEMTKLGTCVFKTEYYREEVHALEYDKNWQPVKNKRVVFAGPKVFGVSLGDILFDPGYQHIQRCPVVMERQRTTYYELKKAEAAGKFKNVDALVNQGRTSDLNKLEAARQKAAGHETSGGLSSHEKDDIVVQEIWCDYPISAKKRDDGSFELGTPEKLVITYHRDTRTFLQRRLNWYFHQRYPYTVMPFTVTNDSILGLGIAEMVIPFQKLITQFEQMAADNAYLANIRMFIAKKGSSIEDVPRLYGGRVFKVDDPSKDFIPFQAGDIYPSTLQERQNLFGLVEKRTGVSDYLTGRESPIIGSRATATSTLALIKEGMMRVEEVLENIRMGVSEIIQNCLSIWIQFGLGDVADLAFGDDEILAELKEFFAQVSKDNVGGAIGIDLAATDAGGNRQVQQQMQLAIIQIMMQYLEKLLEAGQAALMARQVMPEYTSMIGEVMTAARNMFKDLLHKYDIRNPDDYLPDLEAYLGAVPGPSVVGGPEGRVGGPPIQSGLPAVPPTGAGPVVPRPATPGSGRTSAGSVANAGNGAGAY